MNNVYTFESIDTIGDTIQFKTLIIHHTLNPKKKNREKYIVQIAM